MMRASMFLSLFLSLLTIAALTLGCTYTSNNVHKSYTDTWDQYAPRANLYLESVPTGALVEIFNEEDKWVVVGNTGNLAPLLLEATGKPYVIRFSKRGHYREVVQVALNGRDTRVQVPLRKDEYADPADYMHREFTRGE